MLNFFKNKITEKPSLDQKLGLGVEGYTLFGQSAVLIQTPLALYLNALKQLPTASMGVSQEQFKDITQLEADKIQITDRKGKIENLLKNATKEATKKELQEELEALDKQFYQLLQKSQDFGLDKVFVGGDSEKVKELVTPITQDLIEQTGEILTHFVSGVKSSKDKTELIKILQEDFSNKELEEVLINITNEERNNFPDFLRLKPVEQVLAGQDN